MQVREVISSLTFRYIAKYVTVLSAAVFLLVVSFYVYFSYSSFGKLGESVIDELETLQLIYTGQQMAGVEQYIDDQRQSPSVNRFYYLITDAQRHGVREKLHLHRLAPVLQRHFKTQPAIVELTVTGRLGQITGNFLPLRIRNQVIEAVDRG